MSEMVCCTTCIHIKKESTDTPCCVCTTRKRSMWEKNPQSAFYSQPTRLVSSFTCKAHRGEKVTY